MRAIARFFGSLLAGTLLLIACRIDGSPETPRTDAPPIEDAPVFNERVRHFLRLSTSEQQRAFDDLSLDDALDVAAAGLLSHPPYRHRLKACLARFGNEVLPALIRRLHRANPNSDIEITLDLLEEAFVELPQRQLSTADFAELDASVAKLRGAPAREWAAAKVARMRNRGDGTR